MKAAAFELENVCYRWPHADRDCLVIDSLRMSQGERVMLRGPSGSGKSTLLALLGGVLRPDRGAVTVLGTRLDRLSPRQRDRFRGDHIGFLFQQFNLVPYLSVLENVLLPCGFSARRRANAAAGGAAPRAEAGQLLARLDLEPSSWTRAVTRLSVGQQQRVAIARALIGRPELIIADEPTSALDEQRKESFLTLLFRECAQAQSSLLFASHDMRLAARFDRVLDMGHLNAAAAREEETCAI